MAMIEPNWRPDTKQLRNFSLICLAAFGLFGGWVWWQQSVFGFDFGTTAAQTTATTLWVLAAACGLAGLMLPKAAWPVYALLTAVSLPIGLVILHVVLVVLYYGILTPVGLLFRLIGRDALQRRFQPEAVSYWSERQQIADLKRYFRQF